MKGPQDGIRWLVNVNGIVDSRCWMCIGFMTLKLHPLNGVGKLQRTHDQVISVHFEIQPPFSTKGRTSNSWDFVPLDKIPYVHLHTRRSVKHISYTHP